MKGAISILACLITSAPGLIFYESANPPANTETAPTGTYLNSGWQHQIVIDRGPARELFFGTIISPKHFVTARHLGLGQAGTDARVFITQPDYVTGSVEKRYTLRNANLPAPIQYVETGSGITRNTDLYVYEIWETFPAFAELYSSANEEGKECVITGFGDSRGTAVNTTEGQRGWRPDVTARTGRWGTNRVDGTAQTVSGSSQGLVLYCDFDAQGIADDPLDPEDADATVHECQMANKDSGGGWFINDGGTWKLAAINLGVDTYGTVAGSTGNRWAIYDGVGLYHGTSTTPIQPCILSVCDFYRRSHGYATRISEHVSAINAVIQPAKDLAILSNYGRFEAWAQSYGLTAGVTMAEDSDLDGLSNLEEYLTESNPNSSEASIQPLSVDLITTPGTHTFTLVESLDLAGRGLSAAMETSEDLSQWDPVTGATETANVVDSIAGTRTRTLTLPFAGTGAVYYRLKISVPAP